MNAQRSAELQVVLEGIRLPATRAELVAYARSQDPSFVRDLAALPDVSYDRIDAVGEVLYAQPKPPAAPAPAPRAESGLPPGGDDYVTPFPESGAVRKD
jgi:Protein of unknown function (DUF2795)